MARVGTIPRIVAPHRKRRALRDASLFGGAPLHVFLRGFIATHAVLGDDAQGHVQFALSVAVESVPDGVSEEACNGEAPARAAKAASARNRLRCE